MELDNALQMLPGTEAAGLYQCTSPTCNPETCGPTKIVIPLA